MLSLKFFSHYVCDSSMSWTTFIRKFEQSAWFRKKSIFVGNFWKEMKEEQFDIKPMNLTPK